MKGLKRSRDVDENEDVLMGLDDEIDVDSGPGAVDKRMRMEA